MYIYLHTTSNYSDCKMGNCSHKGVVVTGRKHLNPIRIMTDSGRILEFQSPKFAGEVTVDFPGYGIFGQGRMVVPMLDLEQLKGGQFYYLLPIVKEENTKDLSLEVRVKEVEPIRVSTSTTLEPIMINKVEPIRVSTSTTLESIRVSTSSTVEPVTKNLRNGSGLQVLAPLRKGVWKVKLVIGTKELEKILSEQLDTEALIEQMRMAAKTSTPRSRYWGGNLRPMLSNVFKISVDQHKKTIEGPEL